MTKDELKSLIAAKIAGQGTQVDLGNALPTILNEIVDQLGGGGERVVTIDFSQWGALQEEEFGWTDPEKIKSFFPNDDYDEVFALAKENKLHFSTNLKNSSDILYPNIAPIVALASDDNCLKFARNNSSFLWLWKETEGYRVTTDNPF